MVTNELEWSFKEHLVVLQGEGRDDSPSDNMLLRYCENTNCSPACGSTVRGKTSGVRLRYIYILPVLSDGGGLDSTVGIATRYSDRKEFKLALFGTVKANG